MKAISLWQPWASLWLTLHKLHETRHWPTRHRGPLLVHAAKRPIDEVCDDELHQICVRDFGADYRAMLPRGALIGIVNVVACVQTVPGWPYESGRDNAAFPDDRTCGDWSAGRFAWRADRARLFAPPVACRGAQGLFEVPDGMVPGEGG